ncbi:hypothetical protein FDP41_012800 [Naegleria fowleri]|uniref:Uncharacterized protein n=1 Tax=Naegleria fowleri TaxID=5763 RepID=A0A6A5C2N3_NAEFO|nr:uncharacterized protein FDP41_012800 [Naegleria fowleri]KAF0981012.1 hypothetical protein FDP41_012800 [Naegleria fowleri]CAG4716589.1 unnamed protein product [Naegleria fowleri]
MNRRPPGILIIPVLAGVLTSYYAWKPYIEEKQAETAKKAFDPLNEHGNMNITSSEAPKRTKRTTIPSTRAANASSVESTSNKEESS